MSIYSAGKDNSNIVYIELDNTSEVARFTRKLDSAKIWYKVEGLDVVVKLADEKEACKLL